MQYFSILLISSTVLRKKFHLEILQNSSKLLCFCFYKNPIPISFTLPSVPVCLLGTLCSQLSRSCSFFMHGRALCQLLSRVKCSSEAFRYIFTAKWWEKKPFFSKIGKQWFIHFFPQRLSSFQTPLCATPATCQSKNWLWVPHKGPRRKVRLTSEPWAGSW